MKDDKGILRYLGFRALSDGGREFDFSVTLADAPEVLTTVGIPMTLFSETDRLTIQECPGICYETLLSRIEDRSKLPPRLNLTSADIAQHRRIIKPSGRRR